MLVSASVQVQKVVNVYVRLLPKPNLKLQNTSNNTKKHVYEMKIGSKYSIKHGLSVEIYDETIFSYLQKFRLNLTKNHLECVLLETDV